MDLSEVGEFGLIDRIRKISPRGSREVVIGIGDDAAAWRPTASSTLLATTDLLLEGVHFDLSYTDYYSLGWKSAAVNLSDIAAMGGTPRFCLTALGIPATVSAGQVLEFYRGFNDLLRRYGTALIGGDTCASANGLVVSVTAFGEANGRSIVRRTGARPGDRIFVTGTLGDAAAGLELLQMGIREPGRKKKAPGPEAHLLERHLRPEPRIKEALVLAGSGCASSMIDVSDGLSSDLLHLCEQSAVGAEIREEAVPRSPALAAVEHELHQRWPAYALSGGEDYELLFTVPPRRLVKLRSLPLNVTEIGMVRKGRSLTIVTPEGRKRRCGRTGYDHFPRAQRSAAAQ
jgi:thiamine-monophosphate kinase